MSPRYGGRSEGRFRLSARKAGRSADHVSPLRKIIGRDYNLSGTAILRLECGHEARYPSGAWSEEYTPGVRRRCSRCARGVPADFDARIEGENE